MSMETNNKKRFSLPGGLALGTAALTLLGVAASNVARPPVCVYGPPEMIEKYRYQEDEYANECKKNQLIVRDLVARHTKAKPDKIEPSTSLKALKLNKKQKRLLKADIEKVFKVTIPADKWNGFKTVGSIYEFVNDKVNPMIHM